MIKYIRADLYRIFRRIPRWIMFGVLVYLLGSTFWPKAGSENTSIDLVNVIETCLKYTPPVIGFIEMIYVFSDDFQGKTAQIAIGTGISRLAVVLTKWIDVLILSVIDILSLTGFVTVLCYVDAKGIPGELLISIFDHAIVAIISVIAYIAIVMPIMFMMQNITVALLIYMLLSFGLIFKGIQYLAQMEAIQKFNISVYTLTNGLNVFRSRMVLGTFHVASAITVLVYIILGVALTYYVYKNKELEF